MEARLIREAWDALVRCFRRGCAQPTAFHTRRYNGDWNYLAAAKVLPAKTRFPLAAAGFFPYGRRAMPTEPPSAPLTGAAAALDAPLAEPGGRRLRLGFVLLLAAGMTLLFGAVIWPFIQALILAAIFAGLARPLHLWLARKLGGREVLASALTLLILCLVVAAPLAAFLLVATKQAITVGNQAIPWIQQNFSGGGTFDAHGWLVQRFPTLTDYVPSQEELAGHAANAAKAVGGWLVGAASSFGAGTANFAVSLFVMLYAMFYFLKDGPAVLARLIHYLPLSHEDEVRMFQRFMSVARATVKGTLVIGLVQGALAGLAFWVAGIGGAAFWGAVMAFLSVVPGIGAALVWIPAVIYLLVTGQTLAGILLGAWCAGVVGTIDNILRPKLVGKDARMPDLLILVGTLGGIYLFGPAGFILGPVVCGLFLTSWDIYGRAFRGVLPPVKSLHAAVD